MPLTRVSVPSLVLTRTPTPLPTPVPQILTTHTIAIDMVQEKVLGQGDQSNESAVEQAKDEQISDFIRGQYQKTTGSEIPIKDKERF